MCAPPRFSRGIDAPRVCVMPSLSYFLCFIFVCVLCVCGRASLCLSCARRRVRHPRSFRMQVAGGRPALGTSFRHAELPLNTRNGTGVGKKPDEINYAEFWRSAWAQAKEAVDTMSTQTKHGRRIRWPKVYIYELPASLNESFRPDLTSVQDVFGPPLQQWSDAGFRKSVHRTQSWWARVNASRRAVLSKHVRDTNHYGFTKAFLYRLWHSSRYRTLDPAAADLFLVPVFPLPKRGGKINSACDGTTSDEIAKALPHLDRTNAHKHLLVLAKEQYEGYRCKGWWADPKGLFKRMMRLSYSVQQPERVRPDLLYYGKAGLPPDCHSPVSELGCPSYPNGADVPYLSNVHWPLEADGAALGDESGPPWADSTPRQVTMLFLGSATHGDIKVRKHISGMCHRYRDPTTCTLMRYDLFTLLLKSAAHFCLEPAGDSPWRRSITDSVAFGCIPVFFSGAQDAAYDWLWGGWRRAASVSINRTMFLSNRISLRKLLGSVPPELLALYKRTIAAHGRKFTVSLSDDPGDAVHSLLHGAVEASAQNARLNGW